MGTKCKYCRISFNADGPEAPRMMTEHEDMCWRNPWNRHHGGCAHMQKSGWCDFYGDVIPNRLLGRCENFVPRGDVDGN